LEIGRWLKTNGEAIYGTRPWRIYGEGPTRMDTGGHFVRMKNGYTSDDVRFTTKGESLYAIALGWPEDGKLAIRSLARGAEHCQCELKSIELLGSDAELKWTRGDDALEVVLPEKRQCEYAVVLKIGKE
jgi:alpha-L-fucosidase